MRRVCVTGSSGFIGTGLVRRLAGEGCAVLALARSPQENLPSGVQALCADIREPAGYAHALDGCDALYHCAAAISFDAGSLKHAWSVNVEGTRAVFQAAAKAGVKTGILLSGCAVFGASSSPTQVLDETAAPRIARSNTYAYTKSAAERAALDVADAMDVRIANSATVYGPGDRALNSGSFIRSVVQGLRLIPPGGTSWVGLSDLLDGLLALAKMGRNGERYIFATETLRYAELASRVGAALGYPAAPFALPRALKRPAMAAAWALSLLNRGEGLNLMTPQIIGEAFDYKYYDAAKARRELGWQPSRSLEETVVEAYNWYRAEGLL